MFSASVIAGQDEKGGMVRQEQEGVGAAQSYHFKHPTTMFYEFVHMGSFNRSTGKESVDKPPQSYTTLRNPQQPSATIQPFATMQSVKPFDNPLRPSTTLKKPQETHTHKRDVSCVTRNKYLQCYTIRRIDEANCKE